MVPGATGAHRRIRNMMMGYNVYDYLHKFFTEIIQGRRDYENLLPNTIGIPIMSKNS
jgi:hypothetical protein